MVGRRSPKWHGRWESRRQERLKVAFDGRLVVVCLRIVSGWLICGMCNLYCDGLCSFVLDAIAFCVWLQVSIEDYWSCFFVGLNRTNILLDGD